MTAHHDKRLLGLAGVAALALATACAKPPASLEQARQSYQQASNDPAVQRHGPVALYEARQTLDRAEQVWDDDEDEAQTDHLARLADKWVEIARTRAERGEAEEEVARLSQERDQIRLEMRTREADAAVGAAERAHVAAESERERAADARSEAERARSAVSTERERADEMRRRAEELEQSLRELEARPTERGMVLTLGSDVLFAFDRAELKPGAMQNLQRLVEFLQKHPDREVLIEGHTDDVGAESYNVDLSRRRADAVRNFLVSRGIDSRRIVTQGYGEAYPRVANDSPAGRQMNRRVDVVVRESSESQAGFGQGTPPVGAGPSQGAPGPDAE